jgi:hypothetical protein
VLAASRPRLIFDCMHQELADSAATEFLANNERRHLATTLVALHEILDVERAQARDFTFDFGDYGDRRRVGGDAREPLGRLFGCRAIAEFV